MKKSRIIISITIILFGIILISFPFISRIISEKKYEKLILEYEQDISKINLDKLQDMQNEYNDKIENQDNISLSEIYNNSNNSKNILGYIDIPKIKLKRLIYEGSSEDILKNGIGHIENTSMPTGGVNTHAVLVGHTGLLNKVMFDNIDKLQIGDKFYIKNLNNVLEYEVTKKTVVLPNDIKDLSIKEEEDLVTLVTCTPRHINTHRLLVTGKRKE